MGNQYAYANFWVLIRKYPDKGRWATMSCCKVGTLWEFVLSRESARYSEGLSMLLRS